MFIWLAILWNRAWVIVIGIAFRVLMWFSGSIFAEPQIRKRLTCPGRPKQQRRGFKMLGCLTNTRRQPLSNACEKLFVSLLDELMFKTINLYDWTKLPGAPFQYKDRLSRYRIPIVNIRRSWDRIIFIMGIPVLYHYIVTDPCWFNFLTIQFEELSYAFPVSTTILWEGD